jgi:5'/3'-nucleotidase SurE
MKILVTNDDGINAPGIKILVKSLEHLGEVAVVADWLSSYRNMASPMILF